jgi:hypothetical protein
VEDHPLDRDLGLQLLQQVPRDGLALAVLVRGEDQLVHALEGTLELGDLLLLVRVDDVVGLEPLSTSTANLPNGPFFISAGSSDGCGRSRM